VYPTIIRSSLTEHLALGKLLPERMYVHFHWISSHVLSIRGYVVTKPASVVLIKSATWNCLVLDDFTNPYNHRLMSAAMLLVTTKNEVDSPEFPHMLLL